MPNLGRINKMVGDNYRLRDNYYHDYEFLRKAHEVGALTEEEYKNYFHMLRSPHQYTALDIREMKEKIDLAFDRLERESSKKWSNAQIINGDVVSTIGADGNIVRTEPQKKYIQVIDEGLINKFSGSIDKDAVVTFRKSDNGPIFLGKSDYVQYSTGPYVALLTLKDGTILEYDFYNERESWIKTCGYYFDQLGLEDKDWEIYKATQKATRDVETKFGYRVFDADEPTSNANERVKIPNTTQKSVVAEENPKDNWGSGNIDDYFKDSKAVF